MLTVGSLFAGVGGFDLGFESAGCRVIWQCERDERARKVLQARWPEIPCYDDVTTMLSHNPARPDIIVGGFPCQDVSVAGKRAGLAGERTGLFFAAMDVVKALRPDWVVLENVAGLLTSRGGRDFHAVLAELAKRGFLDRAYRVLDSRYFGVAQRRRRVFIVGRAGAEYGRAGAVLLESASGSRDSAPGGETGARVAATLRGRSSRAGVNPPGRGGEDDANLVTAFNWQTGGDCRYGFGDTTTGLSTQQTPAVFYNVASTLQSYSGRQQGHSSPRADCRQVVAPSLTTSQERNEITNEIKVPSELGVRRLTPLECERLQGFPDGFTCLCGAADEYRALLQVVRDTARAEGLREWQTRGAVDAAKAAVLQLSMCEAGTGQSRGGDPGFWQEARTAALSAAALRGVWPEGAAAPPGWQHAEQLSGEHPIPVRVVPREGALENGHVCAASESAASDGDLRLEGLTALCVCPDSPRYKQMGNAVTVNVIEWIATRLIAASESARENAS